VNYQSGARSKFEPGTPTQVEIASITNLCDSAVKLFHCFVVLVDNYDYVYDERVRRSRWEEIIKEKRA
jgi:hypothetical protein